jgi:hypothetical protein
MEVSSALVHQEDRGAGESVFHVIRSAFDQTVLPRMIADLAQSDMYAAT